MEKCGISIYILLEYTQKTIFTTIDTPSLFQHRLTKCSIKQSTQKIVAKGKRIISY